MKDIIKAIYCSTFAYYFLLTIVLVPFSLLIATYFGLFAEYKTWIYLLFAVSVLWALTDMVIDGYICDDDDDWEPIDDEQDL